MSSTGSPSAAIRDVYMVADMNCGLDLEDSCLLLALLNLNCGLYQGTLLMDTTELPGPQASHSYTAVS